MRWAMGISEVEAFCCSMGKVAVSVANSCWNSLKRQPLIYTPLKTRLLLRSESFGSSLIISVCCWFHMHVSHSFYVFHLSFSCIYIHGYLPFHTWLAFAIRFGYDYGTKYLRVFNGIKLWIYTLWVANYVQELHGAINFRYKCQSLPYE